MATQTEGHKWTVGRFNAQNNGILYIKDIDANNQGIFVKLKVSGQVVERQIDTLAVE